LQLVSTNAEFLAPFGCADKPAEKHYWLIYCERKILFQLKKQAEKYGL
jgi:Uri superfamily endonuclease